MLAVRLREHHDLDIRRIAAHARIDIREIADLVGRQRESQFGIGARQRGGRRIAERDAGHRPWFVRLEQPRGKRWIRQYRLGHRIVQHRPECSLLSRRQHAARFDEPEAAALDAPDEIEPADMRDIGRLRRPGRDRARPRHGQQQLATGCARRMRIMVEQALQDPKFLDRGHSRVIDEVMEVNLDTQDRRQAAPERREQSLEAEIGKCGSAPEFQHRARQRLAPGSLPAGNSGTGNWVTLPPSSALILLTPCFCTSSMRMIECSGR